MIFAVIKAGGKQYIVQENEEVIVDKVGAENGAKVEFEMLAVAFCCFL